MRIWAPFWSHGTVTATMGRQSVLAYVIVASCGVYLWECAVMVAIAFKLMCKCVSVCAIKRGSTCRVGAGVLPKLHFCFRIMQATPGKKCVSTCLPLFTRIAFIMLVVQNGRGWLGAVPCVSGVYERGKGGLRGDEEGWKGRVVAEECADLSSLTSRHPCFL